MRKEKSLTRHKPETPVVFMFKRQIPQFLTHVPLKKSQYLFTRDDNTFLMQSCLNVSKDPTVGIDKKDDSFWLRIVVNYK